MHNRIYGLIDKFKPKRLGRIILLVVIRCWTITITIIQHIEQHVASRVLRVHNANECNVVYIDLA